MFTQFFGSYLLNNEIVSREQLQEALEINKASRLKLGVLAINAGYMTAEQIEKVHVIQATVDKRFGDISVEMGFMTSTQVDELLSSQKIGYLLLGQALIDKGYMTNDKFEQAINNYKKENKIENLINTTYQNDKIEEIFNNFFDFELSTDVKVYREYVSLLFRNIIRFVGDDFIPMKLSIIQDYSFDWLATQEILGDFNFFVATDCNEKAFIAFASRFVKEQFMQLDEYVKASIGEFLNLHDGLFCVNMSNEKAQEFDLNPQQVHHNKRLKNLNNAYLIPICFTFGTVNFIIGCNTPSIY